MIIAITTLTTFSLIMYSTYQFILYDIFNNILQENNTHSQRKSSFSIPIPKRLEYNITSLQLKSISLESFLNWNVNLNLGAGVDIHLSSLRTTSIGSSSCSNTGSSRMDKIIGVNSSSVGTACTRGHHHRKNNDHNHWNPIQNTINQHHVQQQQQKLEHEKDGNKTGGTLHVYAAKVNLFLIMDEHDIDDSNPTTSTNDINEPNSCSSRNTTYLHIGYVRDNSSYVSTTPMPSSSTIPTPTSSSRSHDGSTHHHKHQYKHHGHNNYNNKPFLTLFPHKKYTTSYSSQDNALDIYILSISPRIYLPIFTSIVRQVFSYSLQYLQHSIRRFFITNTNTLVDTTTTTTTPILQIKASTVAHVKSTIFFSKVDIPFSIGIVCTLDMYWDWNTRSMPQPPAQPFRLKLPVGVKSEDCILKGIGSGWKDDLDVLLERLDDSVFI